MPTALLIVDVQNDFLPPSGSLAVPDGLDILPHIHKFLQDPEWTARWDLVVATQDWHPRGHISFASAHEGGRPYTKIQVPKRTTDPGFTGDDGADENGEMIDMFIWPDHCVSRRFVNVVTGLTRDARQIPGTKGSEIEQGVRERLQPWLTQEKLAIARKVRLEPIHLSRPSSDLLNSGKSQGNHMYREAFSAFQGTVVTNVRDPLAVSPLRFQLGIED